MELIEIAPGVDLQKHILDHMEFAPAIRHPLKTMDERIFREDPMGLKEDLLFLSLDKRLSYDPRRNIFFVNFEGYAIRNREEIERVEKKVGEILNPLGHKVDTVVNYDNFQIDPELIREYTQMVKRLTERFYSTVTRYTTSTFLRTKLGNELQRCSITPHIYKTQEEALEALDRDWKNPVKSSA